MMVPKPGNANWLVRTQSQTGVSAGDGFGAPEEIFIEERRCEDRQREGDEQPDAAEQCAAEIDYTADNREEKDVPPVLGHHAATELQRLPESDSLVDDNRQRQVPRNGQVNAGDEAGHEADAGEKAGNQRAKEKLQECQLESGECIV